MNAVDYSLKILSLGDYTQEVLRQKLTAKGFSIDEIQSAIHYLTESGIIDDRRYAENYIALKSKVYGVYRMRQHLSKKGIHKDLLDELLNLNDKSSEYEAASSFLRKKLEGARPNTVDKRKLLAALARKGFSYSVASEVLKRELSNLDSSIYEDGMDCTDEENW